MFGAGSRRSTDFVGPLISWDLGVLQGWLIPVEIFIHLKLFIPDYSVIYVTNVFGKVACCLNLLAPTLALEEREK